MSFRSDFQKSPLIKSAIVIALAVTLIRLILSGLVGLGDDESYYWDWSRRISLSYYDHPGMVAWLIRLGTEIFGDNPFGVRFFGLVCNAVAAVLLWLLAEKMFDRKVAAASVLIYALAPILSVGGILMVPDAPMAAAWFAFIFLLWSLWREESHGYGLWILAGIILGLGILSKYTIVLCALSGVALFAFSDRRREFLRPRIYMAIAFAVVLSLPIVLWNVQYDWPSLKYHLQERQAGGGGANFNRWVQFFVSQAIALGPVLFLSCVTALFISFRRIRDPRWRFIALVSSPSLFIFTAQALFAEFKPHWPVPAYPLLFIGVAALSFEWISRKPSSLLRTSLVVLAFAYFALVNVLAGVALVKPVIPKLARTFAPNVVWDPKFDPTNDLYGWKEAVRAAYRIADDEERAGHERPFLSSSRYQLVSQLAFASKETVIRASPAKDEYTYSQMPHLLLSYIGKSAIYITDQRYDRDPRKDKTFASCERLPNLEVKREDELARVFNFWICRGFKGF